MNQREAPIHPREAFSAAVSPQALDFAIRAMKGI
jgi:hypothetical protein